MTFLWYFTGATRNAGWFVWLKKCLQIYSECSAYVVTIWMHAHFNFSILFVICTVLYQTALYTSISPHCTSTSPHWAHHVLVLMCCYLVAQFTYCTILPYVRTLSDNTLLAGRTLDYGPFGWMEKYDPMYQVRYNSNTHMRTIRHFILLLFSLHFRSSSKYFLHSDF